MAFGNQSSTENKTCLDGNRFPRVQQANLDMKRVGILKRSRAKRFFEKRMAGPLGRRWETLPDMKSPTERVWSMAFDGIQTEVSQERIVALRAQVLSDGKVGNRKSNEVHPNRTLCKK